MKLDISIDDINLDHLFNQMDTEEKRAFIERMGMQDDVIRAVSDYLTGKMSGCWTSEDHNLRGKILEEMEIAQLADSVSYCWEPIREITARMKEIRCKQHIYWALHHGYDPDGSRHIHEWFKKHGIESDYTTEQADKDIEEIKAFIKEQLSKMLASKAEGKER